MRFSVIGADKETGDDVDVVVHANTRESAEADAVKRGILVSTIQQLPEEKDIIDLVDEAPAAGHGTVTPLSGTPGAPASPAASGAHGRITLSANSPGESGFSGEAGDRHKNDGVAAMEYHVVMNQALYLMETAVNKYLRDGWEPAGGLTVGTFNNALQYFQALMRKRQPGAPETKHD